MIPQLGNNFPVLTKCKLLEYGKNCLLIDVGGITS